MNSVMCLLRAQTDYDNPHSLGAKLRSRRMQLVKGLIDHAFSIDGYVKILDVGGRRTYWNVLSREYLQSRKVRITLLNLPDEPTLVGDEVFEYTVGDACDLRQYDDKSFHLVHSNSVIEHVGGWEKMKRFAKESNRIGRQLYIQTPYFWFPIEPHYITPFFHWLPRPCRVWLVQRFTLGNRGRARDWDHASTLIDEAPRLIDIQSIRVLYPDCEVVREKFLFLTKSLIAVRRGT